MKPVALIEYYLLNSTKPGDIVLDLFGGSGSSLIACEKLGRAARLVELDEKFVDVIVRRWQDFTGKQGVLESTGQTFADVAAGRSADNDNAEPADAVA
jgi:DNA modification methylase